MAQRIPAAILILATPVILALPTSARRKDVAPTFSLPAQAGSAFRSGGLTPPWRGKLAATEAPQAATPAKPFTQTCSETPLLIKLSWES